MSVKAKSTNLPSAVKFYKSKRYAPIMLLKIIIQIKNNKTKALLCEAFCGSFRHSGRSEGAQSAPHASFSFCLTCLVFTGMICFYSIDTEETMLPTSNLTQLISKKTFYQNNGTMPIIPDTKQSVIVQFLDGGYGTKAVEEYNWSIACSNPIVGFAVVETSSLTGAK